MSTASQHPDAVPAPPAPDQPPVTGRARLRSAMTLRLSRARLLAGALCLVLGLAVAVQVRQRTSSDLSDLRQSELVGLLSDATDRSDRLDREISDLQRQRDELRTSGDAAAAARSLAQQRLDTLGILAGTTAATGPGVVVKITVPAAETTGLRHAALLLDAVQELRDAGAEAIQIGTARVVADTAFTDDDDGGVTVGDVHAHSPFVITAIGSAQTLASAMDFPDGVVSNVQRAGGATTVAQRASVDVTALQRASSPAYAQPVTPSDEPSQ